MGYYHKRGEFNLVYSMDEKQKMNLLFTAFGDYISEHTYFDIVYSEKLGYLRIVPDEREDVVMRIDGFEHAARMLIWDFFSDAEDTCSAAPNAQAILNRIQPYLSRLPEPEHTACGSILREISKQWNP